MTGEQAVAIPELFARAREAYGAGDWAACRTALDKARALDPESLELKRWQARLAYREGDWQGLSEAAQAYLAFHPQDREMAQLCARGFSSAKQWGAATQAWRRVAELRPDWPEAWLQLARAQLRDDVPHLAAASARRLSALAGTDAILAAARLAIERGQMAEGAGHFARLAAEAPERGVEELRSLEKKTDIRATVLAAVGLARGPQGETYKGIARSAADDLLPRALAAERRGRTLDAHLDYAVLAQVEPDDMIAKTGMRRTLQKLQDDAKERAGTDRKSAQKAYLQILFLQPGDTRALTALGQIAMAEQDWSKASELWSTLLEIAPGDTRALVQNARALDRAQDFPRATAAWRAVLTAEPANTEAQLALSKLPGRIVKAGREAVDAQRYVEAVALFSSVPPDSPEHETTLRRLDQVVRFLRREMRAAYKTRHFEQVVRYGTAAVSVQPEHEDLQRLLAQSAMRTRDYALAAAAWGKAVALSPPETRGAAILHLARCRLRLGEAEESRALVAGLLRDEPENAEATTLAREIAADIQSRGAASPTEKDFLSASETPKPLAQSGRVPLGIAFMQARMTRDFAASARIGETILAGNPGNTFVRRALARQFDELGEPGKAEPHWAALRAQDPKDFEAAYHVAQGAIRAGSALGSAVAAASDGTGGAFADNLRAVLDAPALAARQDGMRHVLICGVSYCGSTLFDRLLGSLPGAASIGESHWLVKGRYEKGYDAIDFSGDFAAHLVKCSVCGARCPVLTAEFRRALAADRTDWYFKIAGRLGTDLLISSDKNPPKIADHDPLLRFDALVLFKSLPQAWWSELQKRPQGRDDAYYLSECEKYVVTWAQSYATFLESFSPQGRVVFLSFEDFTRSPSEVLEAACRALALPFEESVLRSAKPGHAIGGNARAMSKLRDADYTPDIAPIPPCDLPAAHLRAIEQSAEAARVFALLQAAHHTTMHS